MTKNLFSLSKNECTVLRGIAILTVILSHTCGVCHLFDGIPLLGNELVCSALCKAGMPLFLFISGYGLHMSYVSHGLRGFWTGRISSVFIPYIIIQVLCMLLYTVRYGNSEGFLYNITVLLGINASNSYDPTMWYISYILFWYIIFFIAYKLGRGQVLSIIIIGIISLAGFFYVPFYWGKNADYCIMTFLIGVLTAWLNEKNTDKGNRLGTERKNTAAACLSFIVLAFAGYTLMIGFPRLSSITENIGSLMAGTAFIILIKHIYKSYTLPVLSFFGTISFPLYLLEWKLIIKSFIYDRFGTGFLTYGIAFILTILLSICLNKVFRKLTDIIKGWHLKAE